MIQRGLVFSDLHDGVTHEDLKHYYSGDYKLEFKIKIEDGIIHFDNRKTHIKNLEQILEYFYNDSIQFGYEHTWFLRKKENNLDGKEMFYASYLASKGEATVLYGDFIDENNNLIKSTMLFLPSEISRMSSKKIEQVLFNLNSRDEELFGSSLCTEEITNLDFKSKEEIKLLLEQEIMRRNECYCSKVK
jgi:hypothetical protein